MTTPVRHPEQGPTPSTGQRPLSSGPSPMLGQPSSPWADKPYDVNQVIDSAKQGDFNPMFNSGSDKDQANARSIYEMDQARAQREAQERENTISSRFDVGDNREPGRLEMGVR